MLVPSHLSTRSELYSTTVADEVILISAKNLSDIRSTHQVDCCERLPLKAVQNGSSVQSRSFAHLFSKSLSDAFLKLYGCPEYGTTLTAPLDLGKSVLSSRLGSMRYYNFLHINTPDIHALITTMSYNAVHKMVQKKSTALLLTSAETLEIHPTVFFMM